MGIFVASFAFAETNAGVFDETVGFYVALDALQIRMPTGKRETRRLVVKFRDSREVVEAMAALALHSELALVFVLMA